MELNDKNGDFKEIGEKKEDNSVDQQVNSLTDKLQKVSISSRKYKTLCDVTDYMKSDRCRNIIVLTGAGISTSCGIPDFRSPGTGIYDNLASYNLPYPQALFEIDYFIDNPEPFYRFCKKNLDCFNQAKPSIAHYFIKLLEDKGKLKRVFTQNIDGLESKAGISEKLVCEAHGSLKLVTCLECGGQNPASDHHEDIKNDRIPHCKNCNGLVKPDIVFFGEDLGSEFYSYLRDDVPKCDLLLIMGTSLQVQPVASIVDMVEVGVPRVSINLECSGVFKLLENAENVELLDEPMDLREFDVYHCSTCDDGCLELAKLLGWDEDLKKITDSKV